MKPFSKRNLTEEQRVFNYRLSRARRVSENAFGIMGVRFCVLYTMMCLGPQKAVDVTLAYCALHNMLIRKPNCPYTGHGILDGEDQSGSHRAGLWRKSSGDNKFHIPPKEQRKILKKCRRNAQQNSHPSYWPWVNSLAMESYCCSS